LRNVEFTTAPFDLRLIDHSGTLEFDDYVVIKWSANTFMLNVRKLNEEDNIEVRTCAWYEVDNDGIERDLSVGTYHSFGPRRTDVAKTGYGYYFVINEGAADQYTSTIKVISDEAKSAVVQLLAYPNPARSGIPFFLEGIEDGDLIEVFTIAGTLVQTTHATDNPASITLNVPNGMYVVRTKIGETRVVIEN